MRIALILLSIVALMFIGSISWSLLQSGTNWVPQKTSTEIPIDIETLRYQIKTEEKIKELEIAMKELSRKNGGQGSNDSLAVSDRSGALEKPIVKVSGKFLAKIMPMMTLTLTGNRGIYGLYTFDMNTTYSTYEDAKLGITVIASSLDYPTFLKNMRSLGSGVYSVNETKTFPEKGFYLNPPKTDTTVRIVLEFESETIALEIPKSKFPMIKNLLLKK